MGWEAGDEEGVPDERVGLTVCCGTIRERMGKSNYQRMPLGRSHRPTLEHSMFRYYLSPLQLHKQAYKTVG
jgi:hypothetical protein